MPPHPRRNLVYGLDSSLGFYVINLSRMAAFADGRDTGCSKELVDRIDTHVGCWVEAPNSY